MSARTPRGLGTATLVALVAGSVTAVTAVGLFAGARASLLVPVHLTAAALFFVAVGVKLAMLGARARPARARRSWRLLMAQLGGGLASYTLLTGVLVLLDPAWSDQHLAASFWLGVVIFVHARHYAGRLPRIRVPRPQDLHPHAASSSGDAPQEPLARRSPGAPTGSRGPKRLIVVGGGMAGHAVVEAMSGRQGWQISLLAEERVEPYDRIALSDLLRDGGPPERLALRPPAWYAGAGVDLRLGAAAIAVDVNRRQVVDGAGAEHRYDALVLATGSRAFVPPIPGAQLGHVIGYRTVDDAKRISTAARRARTALVVGGGLLGLEAAAALAARGLAVTAVEGAGRLMPQQLDDGAATVLRRSLSRLGVEAVVATTVSEIAVGQVCLADGTVVDAELVVVAAGIRSETALARAAGLDVDRGVVVDDEMRASAPGIWAVGECAQHRGVVHGLWPPVANQVGMAVASLDGEPVPFAPSTAQATLKVAGLRAFTAGRSTARAGEDEVVHSDGRYGRYAKLVIDGDRLVGAVLLGDTTAAGRLRQLIASGDPAPIDVLDRSDAMPRIDRPRGDPRRQDAVVCQCMTVSRERIEQAIDVCELASVDAIAAATGAGTGCGSCAGAVTRIIDERTGKATPGEVATPTR